MKKIISDTRTKQNKTEQNKTKQNKKKGSPYGWTLAGVDGENISKK
jgi:hypothetical protein